VTVVTVVNVAPPDGRSANVAVWVFDVVGQFVAGSPPLTHVYVPRNVTRSLYATDETDGAESVKPTVAAATPPGPMSAAARTSA
jgi:hypothetical protein